MLDWVDWELAELAWCMVECLIFASRGLPSSIMLAWLFSRLLLRFPSYWTEACKLFWILGSNLILLPLNSVGQSKSQAQSRFKWRRNRLCIGETLKSHSKEGRYSKNKEFGAIMAMYNSLITPKGYSQYGKHQTTQIQIPKHQHLKAAQRVG